MLKDEYDDETLQKINEDADLLEYVSQSLELEKRGNDYWAHCPKHQDKTPSLSFTPSKNSYYCFSCGRSGGIIGYLIDYENLSFEDAVDKAANLAKIDLSTVCHSHTINFLKKLKTLYSRKTEAFQHEILSKKELNKYSIEPITEWIDEGINVDIMKLFGVRIDNRQNRIIYPVYDIKGNLINIKGRTRYSNYKQLKIPKYINYYPVGVMDYFQGLNITLSYIKEKKEVIVFESVKSVMKAFEWGYKNCISAEKHTLTKEQVDILIKLRVDIVLAYDTDVDYYNSDVWQSINKLKRITNVYIIQDKKKLLGGKETKNSPADKGKEIFEELYNEKKKVV